MKLFGGVTHQRAQEREEGRGKKKDYLQHGRFPRFFIPHSTICVFNALSL